MLYLVPSIERQTVLFQALWGAVFLGGIGQALSSRLLAFRRVPFIGFTALEIIGAPLFVFWQKQVERSHAFKG